MENIKNILNTLQALEKACKKAKLAIDKYNAIVSNCHRSRNYDNLKLNGYFDKAARIYKEAAKQHEQILTNLWNKGIFL